jgi:hypothetical protein
VRIKRVEDVLLNFLTTAKKTIDNGGPLLRFYRALLKKNQQEKACGS